MAQYLNPRTCIRISNEKLDGPSGEKQTTTYQFTVKQPVADPGFKVLTLKHW